MSAKGKQKKVRQTPTEAATQGPWRVEFFQRHSADDVTQSAPGFDYLQACPPSVQSEMLATLKAVAAAPPPMFSGGGRWEAMHDQMKGIYEVRDKYSGHLYRLFCILERTGTDVGLKGPSLVVLCGMTKADRSAFGKKDYDKVKALEKEYRQRTPRVVKP